MRSLKGKNVLVTGGAGFIGSHLTDALLKAGVNKLVVVDNFFVGKMENLQNALANYENIKIYKENAADLGAMEAIIKQEQIEIVYNMATMALIYSFFNPHGAYMINVQIADVLMNLMRNGAFKTLIHMSSSEAYGTAMYAPMDENHPMYPTTPYAAGKAAADLLIKSFYNVYKLDITIIRPFNNYGPRQNEGNLAGIIPITAKRILTGQKPVIEGDGEQTRDYIYVEDTVRGLLLAYENGEKTRGEIINLGSGKELKIKSIIENISKYYNYQGEIEYKPERTADVKRLCASSEKAKKLLGFEPEIDFEEGIVKTLNWYEKKLKNKE